MNTIPTIAAGFPSLCAAAWIGQGRAFERRFPDASATGAPRCYHLRYHLAQAKWLLCCAALHQEAVKRLRRRIAP